VARPKTNQLGYSSNSSAPDSEPRSHRARTAELPKLDRTIHERIRLGIVSSLAINESLSFNDLKRLLKTTDGNLSVHARKLEDAGYVVCKKYFEGRIPRSEYKLSTTGRRALDAYLQQMEELIRVTRDE
jgi:DNA-binding HxlR family transcriptional regulator